MLRSAIATKEFWYKITSVGIAQPRHRLDSKIAMSADKKHSIYAFGKFN